MLSWLSVDAHTGVIRSYLPDLAPQGPCAVTIGRYESLQFDLPLPEDVIGPPDPDDLTIPLAQFADFKAATEPGRSVLIALDELNQPIWGGLILQRTLDEGPAVHLSTVTLEAYFDRRYVGPYNVIGRDQNLIVSDLISQFIQDGILPGLPIRVAYTASATTQSVVYNDYDDKTIYSILNTMSSALGGPEWSVSWERQHTPERITPVLTVADRLGTAKAPALARPNALFSMPGCVTTFSFVTDWSVAKGANRVTATGSQGSGLTRPEDTENVADFAGHPTFEYRYAPQQTANSTLTVQQHALAALAALEGGTQSVTLTASVVGDSVAPVLGVDWNMGDDIAIDIAAPSVIDGTLRDVQGRAMGWSRDDTTITPTIFVQDVSAL